MTMTTTRESMSAARAGRLLWLGVILALIVGLPFLTKPLHIDDTVVLAVAEQITRAPLRPFDASINWFGDPRPIFEETTNPPLVSYYLAPVVARFGFAEAPLHAAMLLFLVVLAVAMVTLSRRFAGGSAWPVLFVMLSPAVVVSTNVMRDVPLAALSAAAAALFITGVDRRQWPLVLAGSLVAGLAALTKYSGAVMLPVLALYALGQRRGRYAWWLAAPLGLVGLWSLQNELVQGRVHLAYLMAERRGDLPWSDRFYAALVVIGASLFLAPAMLADAARRAKWWRLAGAVIAAGLALVGARMHNDGAVGWQYGLWLTTGAALAFLLVVPGLAAARGAVSRDYADAADTLFLALWAGAVLAFSVFFVMFQAVRHIIPALAPLSLLGVRLLRLPHARERWLPATLGVLVGVQAILAFGVAAADYEYARTYRDFAREARQRLPRPGREVWFSGNWGWQRYALSAGFTLLAEHGRLPRSGDVLIIPERVHKGPLPEGLELTQIEEKAYRGRIPIHTMDGSVRASFYAVVGATMPYVFTGDRRLEVFRVFRVNGRTLHERARNRDFMEVAPE
jgi:4-amino-4-deoxy-L-arabinose transferase-like glycosyltransferase